MSPFSLSIYTFLFSSSLNLSFHPLKINKQTKPKIHTHTKPNKQNKNHHHTTTYLVETAVGAAVTFY